MIDHTKEYQYRNGEKPWKIINDSPFESCELSTIDRFGNIHYHSNDGSLEFNLGHESEYDLIEVKPKIKGYVNVYKHETNNIFALGWFRKTRQEAVEAAEKGQELFARIVIEFEEGEGL